MDERTTGRRAARRVSGLLAAVGIALAALVGLGTYSVIEHTSTSATTSTSTATSQGDATAQGFSTGSGSSQTTSSGS
jgi:hypothetical protein